MKRIIVFCGTGIATSQTVASKLKSILYEKGVYDVKVDAIDVKSLTTEAQTAQMCVSITPGSDLNLKIPTFDGIKILTGMGVEEEIDAIIKEINK